MDETVSELEREWLTTTNAVRLVGLLDRPGVASGRKIRLAACACCRQKWGLFCGGDRLVVEYAERYADGLVPLDEVHTACVATSSLPDPLDEVFGRVVNRLATADAREALAYVLASAQADSSPLFADAIRDIFGNPFRPVSLEPYRTQEVQALAGAMYDEQSFERLDVLADALEDAGCTEEQVIRHCRERGAHFRGCWVIDGLLGRE
jgi:hypothetical protein